jgi:hypothetical protein
MMALLVRRALGQTIPMSLLVGLLIAFGRLSADREFVALQACGVSPARLMRPVALMSLLCAGATAYVLLVACPNGNQTFRELEFSALANYARERGEAPYLLRRFSRPGALRPRCTAHRRLERRIHGRRPGCRLPAIYLARSGRVVGDRQRRTARDGARSRDAAHQRARRTLRGLDLRGGR